ncbi:hypothetical protein Pint_18889 [Pistacia integerrima]|uniref:Uncharacterized protein n=1 Tax=Pistacia integerrima TaxID=434235 RepID=A0ACC0YVI1_9ROSI|nr:hypothetical protein Pint_18889 [Pistacia integerrima]
MTNINGKPVPTFIFAAQPSSFHAFLICIMGACYTSICSIHLRGRKPKVARLYNGLAVVSLAASLLVLLAAAVCAVLKSCLSLNSAMSGA